jgi:DNA adenine methylase
MHKAPFPYFGGKAKIAPRVWGLFSGCRNYVEPFAGSLAVLLARPSPVVGPETVNDFSCFVVNAWRSIRFSPDALVENLLGPVSEVNTEAQHHALMRAESGLRDRLGDPEEYDLDLAAYWIRGANEWIGSGWASGEGPWSWTRDGGWQKRKLPHLGDAGKGINRKLPHLGDAGKGINRKLPHLGDAGKGELERRREFLRAWLGALSDRLCSVRIACGDFERVLGDSCTTKHGQTAVFLDPPYEGTEYVYGDKARVSDRVREYCRENGADPKLKIILCGRGAEHDDLISHGWTKEYWTAGRGYSGEDSDRALEALWLSPSILDVI